MIRKKGLEGQTAVAFLCMFALLMGIFAVGWTIAAAFSVRQSCDSLLQGTQEFVIAQSDYIKYSKDNNEVSSRSGISKLVSDYMRDMGYTGSLTIDVAELPKTETGNADRIVGVRLTTKVPMNTGAFAIFGLNEITVNTSRSFVLHPYSSEPLADAEGWNSGAWWSSESTWNKGQLTDGTTNSNHSMSLTTAPSELITIMKSALKRIGI